MLCLKGVRTFDIFQCQFFAPSSKPTRFLTTLDPLEVGYKGLHELDAEGRYLGPLPKQCPHGANAHKALVGKDEDGKWKAAPLRLLTHQICANGLQVSPGLPYYACGGGEGQTKRPLKQPGGEANGKRDEQGVEEKEGFHGKLVGALKEHRGMPMVCRWHARPPSSFNDGCGLCSPGRWPPGRRNFQGGEKGDFIRKLAGVIRNFTHEVIPDPQRTFFALALGKLQVAPFSNS